MPSYTGATSIYNYWAEYIAKAADLAADTFKCLLTTSAYTPNLSTHSVLADITNEVSGNGYARQTLAGVSFSQSGGSAKFLCDPIVFTASGGSITARRAIIYDDSVASPVKPLICAILLNNADVDVVTTNGNTLTVQIPGTGLFTLGA